MAEKTFTVTLHQLNTYEIQAENEEEAKEIATDETWGINGDGYEMYMDVDWDDDDDDDEDEEEEN
tara:strand:+ start:7668 stop:7862 length:195 start_codon:yes stop_codon:yes gene_type:complete